MTGRTALHRKHVHKKQKKINSIINKNHDNCTSSDQETSKAFGVIFIIFHHRRLLVSGTEVTGTGSIPYLEGKVAIGNSCAVHFYIQSMVSQKY